MRDADRLDGRASEGPVARASASRSAPAVREATRRDLRPLAAVLARALEGDPFYQWMFGSASAWLASREAFFLTFLRVHLRDGLVLTTEGRAGASLWTVPRRPYGGRITRLTLPARMRRLLGGRADLARGEIARLNRSRPTEPHWYLPMLGVDPRQQGRGIGTALLLPVLERSDHAGTPVYVETTLPRNVAFYGTLGFEVVDEIGVESGPTVWGLRRDPRPA